MTRRKWIWVLGVVVVLSFNAMIVHQEISLADAETVYLELRPIDPRSLMQGDYMRLDYEVAEDIREDVRERDNSEARRDGMAVVQLDDRDVATFVRLYDEGPLEADQRKMKWKNRGGIYVASGTYMFQEGHVEAYEDAKYAEVRLEEDGTTHLVGLRDKALEPIVAE